MGKFEAQSITLQNPIGSWQKLKMFRCFWCGVGAYLKRTIINGEPSPFSSSTRYVLFTLHKPNVVIRTSVSSMFFCSLPIRNNVSSSSPSGSFVISYLINSCGLPENKALTVSKKINFKTTSQPDSILTLLKSYGFTEPYISKLISKHPWVLLSDPLKTLKPKLDFFNSKGLHGIELAAFVSNNPFVLRPALKDTLIPTYDILKNIFHTDTNVITTLKRSSSWILNVNLAERMMVNVELLRCEGVPQSTVLNHVIGKPRAYMGDTDKFKNIVEMVKGMGFDPLQTTFMVAIERFTLMSEANWRKKMDVYRRWGWSEDQIQAAFRKNPWCMKCSNKKIAAVMDFLVNQIGYDSSSIADAPYIINNSLKDRIIPRCTVIRILVSKGLIKEKISLMSLSLMTDKSFSEEFVKPKLLCIHRIHTPGVYTTKTVLAPEVINVLQGQLSYQELLLK